MRSHGKPTNPSRVNIALNLNDQQGEVQKELPLKLLVLGDFTKQGERVPVRQRERRTVTAHNLDQHIAAIKPQLNLIIPNHLVPADSDLNVSLQFESMEDFTPDQLIQKVPELNRLLAMRQLLKDLKSQLIDNRELQKKLTTIVKNKKQRLALTQFLNHHIKEQ